MKQSSVDPRTKRPQPAIGGVKFILCVALGALLELPDTTGVQDEWSRNIGGCASENSSGFRNAAKAACKVNFAPQSFDTTVILERAVDTSESGYRETNGDMVPCPEATEHCMK